MYFSLCGWMNKYQSIGHQPTNPPTHPTQPINHSQTPYLRWHCWITSCAPICQLHVGLEPVTLVTTFPVKSSIDYRFLILGSMRNYPHICLNINRGNISGNDEF